jgi:ketosteroid isomerase-like protein
MPLTLPQPVINYLAAVEAKDTDMLALCFADDALVHDEGRDYHGLDAIRSWKQETHRKYKYVMEPLEASVSGKTVKLRARLTGDFPGSPIDLDYKFTLAQDKITSLEIG